MIKAIQIAACGIIYFLIVYLFVIRREARPIIPWTVCIATQSISTVFFYNIVAFFKSFLPEEKFGSLGMVIPSALLCGVNLTVIFIMFGKWMSKLTGNDEDEPVREKEEFRIAPLPSVVNANKENDIGNNDEDDDNGVITIDFIKKMISDGRRDEALKYLKMLAYYGKDEQSREEAARIIADLQGTEAV